ncbi:hypothetical protein [Pseudonocardia broussonetiae]|uniref:Uncharacterized protein n=1 Tax=Pseudonocardia broussonetiae TaxID=2736640 RepID=A0A6M6JDP5_9PSEU|nr:hypothetical protein [Pseudonocardia broussonetiae]QJY45145.1 hypothetical protein HOP40_04310 [Pseudonocardia broussonetiae]
MTAQWWSQPVAAEGSTASEGIRRQLGKPHLDPLTVLIRETAQNTCDAALPGGGDVEFAVRLHRLSGNRLAGWREFLLPEPAGSALGIAEAMNRGPLLMTLSDRGTTGLGGPLRADESPREGERPDFVNFIRNVGERKAVDLGGGSYGFGKGILYNVSRCHLIVADSVCMFRGRLQRRLIGAALGDGFTHGGRRWTGRHWLGVLEDGHTRPLLDDEAEEMAGKLGLPRFAEGATGTSVAIVDVDLGRRQGQDGDAVRTPEEAADFIVSTMLWNLWPRMLSDRPNRLVCSMRRDGFVNEVPDPEQLIELSPFVKAYRALAEEGRYQVPPRKSEPREIGRFAVVKGMAPLRPNPAVAAAAPFEGRAHHCARMRHADLVVDYFKGETPTDEMIQYGAVFRSSPEADGFFAEAEPPTHDDWVVNGLRGTARGVVQLATGFIRDRLREQSTPAAGPVPSGEAPLASLAGRLSGLMTAEGDLAEGSVRREPSGGGRRSSGGPRFVTAPHLVQENGVPVIFGVVQMPSWASTRVVVAEPVIVLDSGVEPVDGRTDGPVVLGWRSVESDPPVDGAELVIERPSDRTWELRVRPSADAVVRVNLTVRELGGDG